MVLSRRWNIKRLHFNVEKPMTTQELFDKIKGILQEKDKLPEILDYGLGAYRPVPIKPMSLT